MILQILDFPVYFPYDYMYPEQLDFMQSLRPCLADRGHALIEMPCGTGKTITLLSLLVSWKLHRGASIGKIVYCTRTTSELEKVLHELRNLLEFIQETTGQTEPPLMALGLAARKALCCHPEVSVLQSAGEVDQGCFERTSSYGFDDVPGGPPPADIEDLAGGGRVSPCTFFSKAHEDSAPARPVPKGVHTLQSLREYGQAKGHCPYWLSRWGIQFADIVVFTYPYMIDPKVASLVSDHFPDSSVVVFDEAHNMDNHCMESSTFTLTRQAAGRARDEAKRIEREVREMQRRDQARLEDEYRRLLDGMALRGVPGAAALLAAPQPAGHLRHGLVAGGVRRGANEPVPGNMRRADHFAGLMRRIADYFHGVFTARRSRVEVQEPGTVVRLLREKTRVQGKQLLFVSERLRVLLHTLRLPVHDFRRLSLLADMVTMMAAHVDDGFRVIYEPEDVIDSGRPQWDAALALVCCDPASAMLPIFERYRNVVLMSGTMSPLHIYAQVLGVQPVVSASLPMTLLRPCVFPMIVSRGGDQQTLTQEDPAAAGGAGDEGAGSAQRPAGGAGALSTSYKTRTSAANPAVMLNYGTFLVDLCSSVPDGVVVFFTSYRYMELILAAWNQKGVLAKLSQHKLLFMETKSLEETELALSNYRRACDNGRGAVFLSIARGKVAEGIDFDGHYGRAVVIFGVPFMPPDDVLLEQRLSWLEANRGLRSQDYRSFDAMRQASQCVGRVLRNKRDYGLMVFADVRYLRQEQRKHLPRWIRDRTGLSGLSADSAVASAQRWLGEMAQPWERDKELGRTLLSEGDVLQRLAASRPPAAPGVAPPAGAAATAGGPGGGDAGAAPAQAAGEGPRAKRPRR